MSPYLWSWLLQFCYVSLGYNPSPPRNAIKGLLELIFALIGLTPIS